MASQLFSPITLRGLTLPNRIVVSPMCTYGAADDGCVTFWHQQHYSALAISGPGQVVIEATAVEPIGRMTRHCLGLYSDATELTMTDLVQKLKNLGNSTIGIQLSHTGRLGSNTPLSEGWKPLTTDGWICIAPSAVRSSPESPLPKAIDETDLERVRQAFGDAAKRANRAGFDSLEIHGAHAMLLDQFLSTVVNQRTDEYGGSLENRMRYPLEIVRIVRANWPSEKPLGIRINKPEGGSEDDMLAFAKELGSTGIDFICVSFLDFPTSPPPPFGTGEQADLAQAVKAVSGLPVRAVGMIASPEIAESVIAGGKADLVAVGRGFLDDPRWVLHAAQRLGVQMDWPPQYFLADPRKWPGAEIVRPGKRL